MNAMMRTLPQTPTVAESGVKGYALTNWFGLVVPAATPLDVDNRLYGDVCVVLAQPEVRDRIQSMGAVVIGSTPDAFARVMREENAKWAKVVKQANIRLQ